MTSVPNLQDFREAVESIQHPRTKIACQIMYLGALRASEAITKTSPWDLKHHRSQPYGLHFKWSLDEFKQRVEVENKAVDRAHKVLLLNYAVAKRKKKDKDKNPIIVYKSIALPTDPKYEPWTIDLLRYLKEKGRLTFDVTRTCLWQWVRDEPRLVALDPKIHTHSFRHYRLSHLAEHYGFDAYDLIAYAGWTMRGGFGAGATGQMDTYIHLSWRRYFSKLLQIV